MDIKNFLIPLPYFLNGEPSNGTLVEMPEICLNCKSNQCNISGKIIGQINICSYGFSYVNLKTIIICGIILNNQTNSQTKKRRNEYPNNIFNIQLLSNLIKSFSYYESEMEKEYLKSKNLIINSYIEEEKYKDDFLEILKPEIIKGLSHVHDFKQIIATIRQHINIIIEKGSKKDVFDDKLEESSFNVKAIYYASQLLSEKLNISKFLLSTDWKYDKNNFRNIKFHKLVVKYVRIYKSEYEKKKLNVVIKEKSFNEVRSHPEALSIIPHTFIDNAIKYAPKESDIIITIKDLTNGIFFSVESYGPKISIDENVKIFNPFFRAKEAVKSKSEGSGYGLFISQQIAKNHFDTDITCKQENKVNEKLGAYKTIFTINFPEKCNVY